MSRRSLLRRVAILVATAAASTAGSALAGERPALVLDAVEPAEVGARVSFRLVDALGDELLERIDSGTPVTFRHRVELYVRRPFPVPNRVLGRVTVDTRVEFDTLDGRYLLTRTVRSGTRKRPESDPVLDQEVTESHARMIEWMTTVADVGVDDGGSDRFEGSRRIRVTSNLGRRYVLGIFPASLSVSAAKTVRP